MTRRDPSWLSVAAVVFLLALVFWAAGEAGVPW